MLLIPSVKIFRTPENSGGSCVDGSLDLLEVGFEFGGPVVQVDIDLEEGIFNIVEIGHASHPHTTDTVLHCIERILGCSQQSLVQIPKVVPLEFLGLFEMDVLFALENMRI